MPGFGDSAVIIVLALLLFGPKKLPQLARQLGKLMADFRRASNEFRTQMEEELRIAEQADRQKEIARIEAAASAKVDSEANSELPQPHQPPPPPSFASAPDGVPTETTEAPSETSTEIAAVPIATSGELSIMPPATGLPVAASTTPATPATESQQEATLPHEAEYETETLHG